jgi:hypothetical protein
LDASQFVGVTNNNIRRRRRRERRRRRRRRREKKKKHKIIKIFLHGDERNNHVHSLQ